jgi:hypothetical protein
MLGRGVERGASRWGVAGTSPRARTCRSGLGPGRVPFRPGPARVERRARRLHPLAGRKRLRRPRHLPAERARTAWIGVSGGGTGEGFELLVRVRFRVKRPLQPTGRAQAGARSSESRRRARPLRSTRCGVAHLLGWDSDCHMMSPWPLRTRQPGPSASAVGFCSTRRLVFHRASLGPEPASRPFRPAS